MSKTRIIFFGNGPLADYALEVLKQHFEIIFHARTRDDLEKVRELKAKNPEIHGVLASFGVMIKPDLLELFEPEGILNIHPSLLPLYRGASPIESAILAGDTDFSVSIMKLVEAMDAGPIYAQSTLSGLPLNKNAIYRQLAETGAEMAVEVIETLDEAFNGKDYSEEWTKLAEHSRRPDIVQSHKKWIERVRHPKLQDDSKATYCSKLDKSMSQLTPETNTAEKTLRKIVAFQGFPKPKYAFFGVNCIVLEAHILEQGETAALELPCSDGQILAIDKLQPEGRKIMDAKSFVNGYRH